MDLHTGIEQSNNLEWKLSFISKYIGPSENRETGYVYSLT